MISLDFSKSKDGLIPAIVQDHESNEILMLAYVNEEAFRLTLQTSKAHYWSRSRNKIWLKGESSGHIQQVHEIRVDCDNDTIIYKVNQVGGASCHKGYRSCFYQKVEGEETVIDSEPLFNPEDVYKK